MKNQRDPIYNVIKDIEATQQQLATETDPENRKHLQEVLHVNLKRLSNITHQNSVQERDHEPALER